MSPIDRCSLRMFIHGPLAFRNGEKLQETQVWTTHPEEIDDLPVEVIEDFNFRGLLVEENLCATGKRFDIIWSDVSNKPQQLPDAGAESNCNLYTVRKCKSGETFADRAICALSEGSRRDVTSHDSPISLVGRSSLHTISGASLAPEAFHDPDAGQRRRVDGLLARDPS